MVSLEDRFDAIYFRFRASISHLNGKRSVSVNSLGNTKDTGDIDDENYTSYDFRKFGCSTRQNRIAQAAVKFDKKKRGTSLRTRRPNSNNLHPNGKLELLKNNGPIVTLFANTENNDTQKEMNPATNLIMSTILQQTSNKAIENDDIKNKSKAQKLSPYLADGKEEKWSVVLRNLEKSLINSIQLKNIAEAKSQKIEDQKINNETINNQIPLSCQNSIYLNTNNNSIYTKDKLFNQQEQYSSLESVKHSPLNRPPRPPPPLSFESLLGLNRSISGISDVQTITNVCKNNSNFETTYFPVNEIAEPVVLQRRNRYGGYVPTELKNNRDSIGLWNEQLLSTSEDKNDVENLNLDDLQNSNFESGYNSNGTTVNNNVEKEENSIITLMPFKLDLEEDVWPRPPTPLLSRKLGSVNFGNNFKVEANAKSLQNSHQSEEALKKLEKSLALLITPVDAKLQNKHFVSKEKNNSQKKPKNKLSSLKVFKIFTHSNTNDSGETLKQNQQNTKNQLLNKTTSNNLKIVPSWFHRRKPINIKYSNSSAKNCKIKNELSKSEPQLNCLSPSDNLLTLSNSGKSIEFLRKRIKETKYVTAVFESGCNGMAPILDDIMSEFGHWLGPNSRLLAVACEVHWSVPERHRRRSAEIKMKDSLHCALRDNNHRVLDLYDECKNILPTSCIESKTEESCSRDAAINAYQGIYRRYYPDLLALQDPTTIVSHKSYWTLSNLNDETQTPLLPSLQKFVHCVITPEQLSRKTLVTVNMATLRLDDDETNYDEERPSNSTHNILI